MRARSLLAVAIAITATASALVLTGAAPASADQVWHQSVGRADVQAPCPASTDDAIALGWSAWGASWEQWANDGQGGWTCTRSITWATTSRPPSSEVPIGCIQVQIGPDWYLDFGSGYFMPAGIEAATSCTPPASLAGITDIAYVYATDGDLAQSRCREGLANDLASVEPVVGLANLYLCGVV